MSILWEQEVGSTNYQVRQAGNSLRLYTNGVFHSQYNPGRPLTGSVWDLLFLPAFFYPPGSIRRVLVLGVGGGAVIQQLRRFIQPESIVGVELNATHLYLAKRFFGVRGKDVELVRADAVDWVNQYRGPVFDIVIDDLFGHVDGETQRSVFAGRRWVSSLTRCLSTRTRRTISYFTCSRSYGSKKSVATNSSSTTDSGLGLRQPCLRKTSCLPGEGLRVAKVASEMSNR